MRVPRLGERRRPLESMFRSFTSSMRSWKVFLCFIILTLLLRQFQFSRQVDSFYFKTLTYSDAPRPRILTETNSTTTAPERIQTDTVGDINFSFGELWKASVRIELMNEERKRLTNTRSKGKKALKTVEKNFRRLHSRLDEVDPSEIDDTSNWHKVTPEGYKETLEKARSSMEEMVDKVYLDCIMWLLPHDSITALEFETDEWDTRKLKKNPEAGPLIRFQCGDENGGELQEKPCRSANLCLVKSDPLEWAIYYSDSSNAHNTSDIDIESGNIQVSSQYNHTDIRRRFSTSQDDPTRTSRSAILTMVDTVHYLRSGKMTGRKKLGPVFFIWECFLNKASYALRTNRDLYIWIGGFEGDDVSGETTPILHQRNTDTLSRTFGANCKPEIEEKNVVHYYKPIAFGALFRKLRSLDTKGDDKKVWFVDADIYFNKEAFPSGDAHYEPLSLDDYFHLSPQASLLGSQNPSGKEDNILINGGLLGLKGSAIEPLDPLDDWVINLSALWWYCRCGERDQIALWLLLFATWSAESGAADFAYPTVVFENYMFAWFGVIPQAQVLLPKLQKSWSQETKGGSSNLNPTWPTLPTDANLFDGGKGFLDTSNSTVGGTYTYPLELPHVLLLPLDPFELPSESPSSQLAPLAQSHFNISIIRKNQIEKESLLTHTKNVRDVCYNFKCWPYLIREDPTDPRIIKYDKQKKKKQKELEKQLKEKKEKESEEINDEEDDKKDEANEMES